MNTDTPNPQPQASKLHTRYDTALLGATVSTQEADRFVYSLKALIGLVMLERKCQPPEARQIILAEMIKPSGASIVYVNDELLDGPAEKPKSVIYQPKKVGKRRWQ